MIKLDGRGAWNVHGEVIKNLRFNTRYHVASQVFNRVWNQLGDMVRIQVGPIGSYIDHREILLKYFEYD